MRSATAPGLAGRGVSAEETERFLDPTIRDLLPDPAFGAVAVPAGYHEGLGVALFCPPGRHIGFVLMAWVAGQPLLSTCTRRIDSTMRCRSSAGAWTTTSTRARS